MQRHTIVLRERLKSVDRKVPGNTVPVKPCIEKVAPIEKVEVDLSAILGLHQAIGEFAMALQARRAEIANEVAHASVELGVQIAERLVGIEVAANRQRLDQIVLTALERIQASRAIAIKANSLDLELLRRQLTENAVPDRYTELLSFQRDDACPRGKLKLETDELFIEWDTQRSLAEIRNALLEEIHLETAVP